MALVEEKKMSIEVWEDKESYKSFYTPSSHLLCLDPVLVVIGTVDPPIITFELYLKLSVTYDF